MTAESIANSSRRVEICMICSTKDCYTWYGQESAPHFDRTGRTGVIMDVIC